MIPDSSVHTLTDLVAYQAAAVVSKTPIKKPAGTVTPFAFDQDQGLSEHASGSSINAGKYIRKTNNQNKKN